MFFSFPKLVAVALAFSPTLSLPTLPIGPSALAERAFDFACPAPLIPSVNGTCLFTGDRGDASDGTPSLVPRVTVGNVYYDNQNRIRLIFTWALNTQIANIFKNSGYDLGKAIMSECKKYLINTYGDDNTRYQARYAAWVGSIDEKSRYLTSAGTTISYATIAVSLTLNRNANLDVNTIRQVAAGIANWVAQGPDGVSIIPVNNAFAVGNERRSLPPPAAIEQRDDSTYYCSAPIGGMFNTGSPHTPRPLAFDFGC